MRSKRSRFRLACPWPCSRNGVRVASELEDAEALVDHDAGRPEPGQQHPVRFARHLGKVGAFRAELSDTRPCLAAPARHGEEARPPGGGFPRVDPVLLVDG